MILIKDLSKKFGRFEALNNINLHCKSGQSIALIGPNGCGKTTLIKSILNMVIPDKGAIIFDGYPIKNNDSYRSHIGYMPQIGRYPDHMNIGQVLETIQILRGTDNAVDHWLYEAYQVNTILHKRMNTLSGGTRQKVSAVIAFMFNPKVLILDEPTAGLDPLASEILKEKILEERKKGKLILITSHLLSELDDIISELIFMQEGCIKMHRDKEALKLQTGEKSLSKAVSKILKEGNKV
jgi:Cu-processing system ATP-binding protein